MSPKSEVGGRIEYSEKRIAKSQQKKVDDV